MSDEKRLIGHAPFPVAAATLGGAHVDGYGADLPRMEETVHEHRNIPMIRRAARVRQLRRSQRDARIPGRRRHAGDNHDMSDDSIGIEA
jgi:hypothetical protein